MLILVTGVVYCTNLTKYNDLIEKYVYNNIVIIVRDLINVKKKPPRNRHDVLFFNFTQ